MTARQLYEGVLIELNKENAPNILLEDFNYFANKAINNYINKRYNIYDVNQQTTDDLRVLKATALLTPSQVNDYQGLTMAGDCHMATYEVVMPSDYLHILNCICIYQVNKTYKCYNRGDTWRAAATRLTADMYSQVLDNFWNKPTYKKPYYYIHNVNSSNFVPTNPYGDKTFYQKEIARDNVYADYGRDFGINTDSSTSSPEQESSNTGTFIVQDGKLKYQVGGNFLFHLIDLDTNKFLGIDENGKVCLKEIVPPLFSSRLIVYLTLSENNIYTGTGTFSSETGEDPVIAEVQIPKNASFEDLVSGDITDGITLNLGVDSKTTSDKATARVGENGSFSCHYKYLTSDGSLEYGKDAFGHDIVQGKGLPNTIDIIDNGLQKQISNIERGQALRYGNVSQVRLEIRYGTDNLVFELKLVYIDYIKAPQNIRLTQQEIDLTEDTSQMLEYPDYVCQEIINELVHLVMENISDLRLQTHPVVTLSIANPAQALAPQAQGLSAQ